MNTIYKIQHKSQSMHYNHADKATTPPQPCPKYATPPQPSPKGREKEMGYAMNTHIVEISIIHPTTISLPFGGHSVGYATPPQPSPKGREKEMGYAMNTHIDEVSIIHPTTISLPEGEGREGLNPTAKSLSRNIGSEGHSVGYAVNIHAVNNTRSDSNSPLSFPNRSESRNIGREGQGVRSTLSTCPDPSGLSIIRQGMRQGIPRLYTSPCSLLSALCSLLPALYIVLFSLLSALCPGQQRFGEFGSNIILRKNNITEYYKLTGDYGLPIPGGSLGTFEKDSETLQLWGAEIKTWKNSGANVCKANINYVIYPAGARPVTPMWTAVTVPWKENCSNGGFPTGGGCSGNDQKWANQSAYINLTNLNPGNYTLEFYLIYTGSDTQWNGCTTTRYISNNSANYKMNFTITAPVINPGNLGGNIYLPTTSVNIPKTENYIFVTEYLTPEAEAGAKKISGTYFDGLGRPKQSVNLQATPDGKDIITPIVYDEFGRQTKYYLPVPVQQNNGMYMPDILPKVDAYYAEKYPGTTNPYSEKELEASPLSRVLKQAAPGEPWKLGNGHEIKFDYQANVANEVRWFTANTTYNGVEKKYTPTLQDKGYYPAGSLYKTITYDENSPTTPEGGETSGGIIEEFKDALTGRVVLKRSVIPANVGTSVGLDTYYTYDTYGNLTYVFPPKLSAQSNVSSLMSDLAYQYIYDDRNRLIEKKLPGKDWEYIVYGDMDRPVATQDGNLKTPQGGGAASWLWTKYDQFGNIIMTGTYAGTETRVALQQKVDAQTKFYETYTTTAFTTDGLKVYYTNTTFPLSNYSLLITNYYGVYPPNSPIPNTVLEQNIRNGSNTTAHLLTAMPTASMEKVIIPGSPAQWQKSYTFYDPKYRPIRSLTQLYTGGYTQIDSKPDFRGKPLFTQTTHKKSPADEPLTIQEGYIYDHMERLLETTQILGAYNGMPATNATSIAKNTYDALGQLITKKQGISSLATDGLQTIHYDYNIRGWLTGINDPYNDETYGFFQMKINYETPEELYMDMDNGVKPLYNGNIAEILWINAGGGGLKRYGYAYDELNRLTKSYYKEPNSALWNTGHFNENLTYDLNGNILSLDRTTKNIAQPDFPLPMDKLTYTYDNGNKLMKVEDTGLADGFYNGNTSGNDYAYDINGNMIIDKNKGITKISYNYLNLPTKIEFGSSKYIEYLYTASGIKTHKKVTDGTQITETLYLGGFQYSKPPLGEWGLSFFPHAEGYIQPEYETTRNGSRTYKGLQYVYNLTDHLGNIRLSYTDKNKDGNAQGYYITDPYCNLPYNCPRTFISEIVDSHDYYPFGLEHKKAVNTTRAYKYSYNGKEKQDELGLNMTAMDFRMYDNALGRFTVHDALSDKTLDPYGFAYNNPIRLSDPRGLSPDDWIKKKVKGKTIYVYDANIKSEKDFKDKKLDTKGYTYLGANKTEVKQVDNTTITTTLKEDGSYKISATTPKLGINGTTATNTYSGKFNFNSNFTTKGTILNYGKSVTVNQNTFTNIIVPIDGEKIKFPIISSVNVTEFKDITSAKESYEKINLSGKMGIATACSRCQDIISNSSQGVGGGVPNVGRIVSAATAADIAHPSHLPEDPQLP